MRVLLPAAAVLSVLLTTATPAATPDPEPGPLATIEVTVERLTFRDADGLVIDELELEEGSEALETALNNHLGPATGSRVDEEGVCSEPGTAYTEWADAGAELRVVPEWQRADQGENIGSMVYDLAPGVEEGAQFDDSSKPWGTSTTPAL